MFRKLRIRKPAERENPPTDVAMMREAGNLVAQCYALLKEKIQPGVRLRDLDAQVAEFIHDHGAVALYKGYQGNPPSHPPFPGVICTSINSEICHGLPDGRLLRDGDIVGIDIGLRYKEHCGDACVTFAVGEITPSAQRLITVAEQCLYKGIDAAKVGRRMGDVAVAIERHARIHGYTVVADWGGHGIGRNLHEYSVPHTGPSDQGPRLVPGMTFTIEPMVNAGKAAWNLGADGWTVATKDKALSAQFEHTIHITPQGAEILSPWHEQLNRGIPPL